MSAQKKEELIDTTRLTQRELLIILHRDVKEIKQELGVVKENEKQVMLKVNTLETKAKVWGGMSGFFGAVAAVIAEKFLLK